VTVLPNERAARFERDRRRALVRAAPHSRWSEPRGGRVGTADELVWNATIPRVVRNDCTGCRERDDKLVSHRDLTFGWR